MSTKFEMYEDNAGEWRWRLVHENGNILADSGEGYSSKSNVRKAVDRIKKYAPTADYLEITPAAFEIYEDKRGEWRWRMVHQNGNVVADSAEGYTSRTDAIRAVKSVKRHGPAAEIEIR